LPEKPKEVLAHMPDIFKTLMKLVKRNAEDRLDYASSIDEGEEQEEPDFDFDDDDDDFWE
jgi:hypothetical protein